MGSSSRCVVRPGLTSSAKHAIWHTKRNKTKRQFGHVSKKTWPPNTTMISREAVTDTHFSRPIQKNKIKSRKTIRLPQRPFTDVHLHELLRHGPDPLHPPALKVQHGPAHSANNESTNAVGLPSGCFFLQTPTSRDHATRIARSAQPHLPEAVLFDW